MIEGVQIIITLLGYMAPCTDLLLSGFNSGALCQNK